MYVIQEEYDEHTTQHYALWQVIAFRVSLAQQKASSWWETSPALQGLCLQDFHPPASNPWNIWAIHEEKTLASARAVQACAEVSRAMPRVLCRAVRELQQCMAPLMTIDGDDVMRPPCGASGRGNGTFSHPRRRGHPSGKVARTSCTPGPAPQQKKSARYAELAEQTTIPVTFIAPHHHPSLKRAKSWEGINIDSNNTSLWISTYSKKDSQLLE